MRFWFVLALAGYAFVVGYLYVAQRQFVFPAPAEVSAPPESVQVVRIPTQDGSMIAGWFTPPALKSAPVIVFFHGNAALLSFRTAWAANRARAGYGVFQAGYRGYDGAPGHPTEEGLYADARAQIRWLLAQGYTALVFQGESLGTGVAVQMATEFRSKGVILEAPYTTLPDVAAGRFPLVPVHWLMKDVFNSRSKITRLNAPLLIVHGTADRVVPIGFGKSLFAAAAEPKEAHWLEGAGHSNLSAHGADPILTDFLARVAPVGF